MAHRGTEAAYAAHPGPKLLLRYEELLADPLRRTGEVLDWLGLPHSPEELARQVDDHAFERIPAEQRGPDRFVRAAAPGRWRKNLTAGEQWELERLIGPKLRELGDMPRAGSRGG